MSIIKILLKINLCFMILPSGLFAQNCNDSALWKTASFPVGVAINTDKLKNDEKYWTTAISQFNSFTPEKILKAQFIHGRKNTFDFSEAVRLMLFCKEKGIRLHGHTLVWHKAIPEWMESSSTLHVNWDSLLKNHITTIISHCKAYIRSWDVVNEAFNEDGT